MDPAIEPGDESIQREAVVETAGSWTCPECKERNNPNVFDEAQSREHCAECGAEKPAGDEQDEPIMAAQGTTVGKPEDVPLPLVELEEGDGFERFNANKAMSTIIAKNTEVQVARDRYESLKKQAAEAKKELDQDEAALGRIITGFSRAREAQNGPQALLPLNGQAPAVESNCPWERDNPGFVCVVCREATKHKLNPDANSEVHPEHIGHEEVADKAHTEKILRPLLVALKAKGLHVGLLDLQMLEGAELQQLIDWTEQDGIVPPAILTTSHLADLPGSIVQLCKTCGTVLADTTDVEGLYPEGARVGFDCHPEMDEALRRVETEVAEEDAAVRKPRSHAKKATSKQREPEQERANQVAAGKAKTAKKAPKAKKGGRK
jgi:hypothetical protein